MAPAFTTTRRVEFSDTDMAGLIHFACYYKFMEQAEHEYLRSLGVRVVDEQDDGTLISWPRLSAECTFQAPAFYEDDIEIRVEVLKVGNSSLVLGYEFWRDETQLAGGSMTTVRCHVAPGRSMHSIPIPEELRAEFEAGCGAG